jgi:hypothetical protein
LDNFWSPGKYYGFLNTFKYDDEKVTLDQYTLIEINRTRKIYNWLQHFDRESIKNEFAACGLKIEQYLGNVAGDEFDADGEVFAVVAKR